MKVRCSHGYFFFEEDSAGDLSRFSSLYGFSIVPKDWYYTFEALAELNTYSLAGASYGQPTALAIKTFAGYPWEVMRENKLIFDFTDGRIKPLASVLLSLKLDSSQNYFYSDGLLLPGSVGHLGKRVTDYTGYFPSDARKFRYTEVLYA